MADGAHWGTCAARSSSHRGFPAVRQPHHTTKGPCSCTQRRQTSHASMRCLSHVCSLCAQDLVGAAVCSSSSCCLGEGSGGLDFRQFRTIALLSAGSIPAWTTPLPGVECSAILDQQDSPRALPRWRCQVGCLPQLPCATTSMLQS